MNEETLKEATGEETMETVKHEETMNQEATGEETMEEKETAKEQTMNAADTIIKVLEQAGVKYMFGIPGGATADLNVALYNNTAIKPILTKHEAGAAMMADGYARISGGIGVCFSTAGPGASNLITGLAASYMDGIPVIALTGQVATSLFPETRDSCRLGSGDIQRKGRASESCPSPGYPCGNLAKSKRDIPGISPSLPGRYRICRIIGSQRIYF